MRRFQGWAGRAGPGEARRLPVFGATQPGDCLDRLLLSTTEAARTETSAEGESEHVER
jgi:hypothetical protein